MKDLRLTKNDDGIYDIYLEDGNFVWAKEGTQVANHAQIRLNVPKGTLSLNGRLTRKEELGLKLYEIMLRHDVDQAEKELEMKRVIMETPGYKSLISFEYAREEHTATYTAHVQTEYGEITIGDTIVEL